MYRIKYSRGKLVWVEVLSLEAVARIATNSNYHIISVTRL